MPLKVYLNGRFVDQSKATVSIFDHGLLYGDGVFEGIRSYDGLVFRLKEHIDRIFESAHTIMLKMPLSKQAMSDAVVQCLRVNKLRNAYIRLVVTRGTGDLGLDPRKCPKPTIFIITDKITLYPPELYAQGLSIITVATQRNVPEALNPQIKSLNYLNNILAKIEAVTAGFEEALMLSPLGYVTEATGENVFIVKRRRLLTPPTWVGVLKGITRCTVMEIAQRQRIPAHEEVLTRHDLFNADECFLTGTAAEIVPVVKIDGRTIGSGQPGPITRLLMKEFRQLTRTEGVRY